MRKKTTVYLEPDLLRTAKVWAARTGRKDYEILEEALKAYLGLDVIESVWARSDIGEDEALALAYSELHASRRQMVRAVLDPGVLIAAFISSEGTPARLLALWIEGAFEMIVSPKLIKELQVVLLREKFRRYSTEEEAERYVEAIGRLAIVVKDPKDAPRVSKDPKDDYLVALAASVSGILVSGDEHLMELDAGQPQVLRPREFLEDVPEVGR